MSVEDLEILDIVQSTMDLHKRLIRDSKVLLRRSRIFC